MAAEPQFTPEPVELTHGGTLAITEHSGDYVLHVTRDGASFTQTLSALDVQAIRTLTGDLVLARLNEISPATEAFMRLLEERPS